MWSFSHVSQSDTALAQLPEGQITKKQLRYSLLSKVQMKLGQALYYFIPELVLSPEKSVNKFQE